jgi:two-component system phosphate regulon sensor histidine kinase PhoR
MKSTFKPIYFTIAASLTIAIFGAIFIYVLYNFYGIEINYLVSGIFISGIFSLTFLTIFLYFKLYLFRNINRILKDMSSFRAESLDYKSINFNQNVIESIDRKVKGWIDENKKEIDKYKVLSTYRKQFLGDISHELKTPLFSVQGYLHTLLDGALYDKEHNIEFLQKAIKNTERLEHIVSDLDMISKFEAGEYVITPSRFNIRKMFEEVFEELELTASGKGIKLLFKHDQYKEKMVYADPKRIRQVCINLVSNAIHYGKDNGFVKVGFTPVKNKITIEVSDNGIGIPEKHLIHLFDRFYRIDASRARNKGGSGLGLSIVKHILNGHNQEIDVVSTPGKGSTFSFTLDQAK